MKSTTPLFLTLALLAAPLYALHGSAQPPTKHSASLTPLTPRERVAQLLDRFTFGPRPGEVDKVLAQGADKWLDAQLNPSSIPDAVLDKRLGDFPTLQMTPQQVMQVFPDDNQVRPIAHGKAPYPTDPLLKTVAEVQVFKYNREEARKKAFGSPNPPPEPTDTEKAAQKKLDQTSASHIFGDLMALPRNQRMAAIEKLPVEDRVTLTTAGDLTGEQRNLLLAEFNPRERETYNGMASDHAVNDIDQELQQGRVVRDILDERQLQAVMTAFWFNHFNIYVQKNADHWYTTSYERDVIRAHALGNFHDLLLATAQSPAMMIYLDNWLSIGPDSIANGVNPKNPKAKRGDKGLNENYGREVMELHTVSVNGGYSQADVTSLSAILTGWGVEKPDEGGPFIFDYKRHEPGPKLWYGYIIDDNGNATKLDRHQPHPVPGPGNAVATPDSFKQGLTALDILAAAPQTAHFISYLLGQYFVADNPPPALVDRLTKVYLTSHGDIPALLRAVATSPEFNSRQYFHNKVKTPEEFVASAYRATDTAPQNPGAIVNQLKVMGMPLFQALPPTGYYLTADQWMNSLALVDRLNFAYQLTNAKFANQSFDAPKLVAAGLLTQKPAVQGSGAEMTLHLLEATMIGAPVSAKTNGLIEKQLAQQPPNPAPNDTLNLLTALVMGSPEFQLR